MIVIDKAILHILDFNTGTIGLSDEELVVENSIEEFLLKHIEKSLANQDAKKGVFYEDSEFQHELVDYLAGKVDFVIFSKYIADTLEKAISHAEEMASADLLICDVRIDDVRKIIIFKANSHSGFIHQIVQTENGFRNDIVNHHSIMPGLAQKMDEFALVDTVTKEISSFSKKYTIDGNSIFVFPEILLECAQTPSPKETIKKINQTVKKVTEAYGQDECAAAAAVKSYIADNVQQSNQLDPLEAGKEVFKDNPSMQEDYDRQLKEAGFTEPVAVNSEATLKKMRNHKLKTDTGIELTIPVDYFDNTEYVEFHNNADGSLSITLKHIQNIMNRL